MQQQDGIYWRNGVAYGRVYANGIEHRRSLRTRDPARAAIEYERFKHETLYPTPEPPTDHPSPTFKEGVVAWRRLVFEAPAHEGLKPATRDRYVDAIRLMASMFADKRLDQINARAIGEWVMARREGRVVVEGRTLRPATNATIRRDLTALSSVFTACNALGLYAENPASTWNRKVIPESKAPFYVPTVAEIEAVAAHASLGFAALIRFAAYTGCRQSEAANLKWPDVRLDRGEARFLHTKTHRPRVISLASPGGDATEAVKSRPRHLGVPLVFWHTLGEGYGNVSGNFRSLIAEIAKNAQASGRPFTRFTFHKMRHAFAIRWLENGGDIYALSKHLGHTSVKTTEIYLDYINRGLGSDSGWDEAEEAAEAQIRTA